MQILGIFLVPALLGSLCAAQGIQFNYPCSSCGCNSATEAHFSNGDFNIGRCLPLGGTFQSVGLSGGSSFHCQMFSSTDCSGTLQNVGIKSGETFGCTNHQIPSFRSARCWTQN
ncbi:hypothetical protein BKA65DRAFT_86656 [Rhexocercosporidium sp. MPI-PUGE-AT-0058]|nr:hypothetical protein BKA65DRAFT_86656 [Rhexocercosporidium sp. MPI-PUGE-AT-0058]